MIPNYDIIIVGGGLIGTSLAVSLQGSGFKIALLEKNIPTAKTEPTAFRPISLAYGTVEILRAIKLWPMLSETATPIQQVQVSEQGVLGGVHFSAQEQGVDALGQVVPFSALHLSLYECAAGQADVDVIPVRDIQSIEATPEKVSVQLDTVKGPQKLTAALLVGCDGTHSRVRDLLKIATARTSQNKLALSAKMTLADEYSNKALERFSRDGVLAILPLAQKKQCGLVWTLSQAKNAEIADWSEQDFIRFINQHFRGRLPQVIGFHQGANFPLQTIIAEQQIQPGVVLLGNSAHTLYPLAAQGFNLGLRDAAALAEVLVTAKQQAQPLGSIKVLQDYVDWRQQDQARIARITGGIAESFSLRLPFLKGIRGFGMMLTDVVVPAKKRLARVTMGVAGKLPKLMRGLPLL